MVDFLLNAYRHSKRLKKTANKEMALREGALQIECVCSQLSATFIKLKTPFILLLEEEKHTNTISNIFS